ncbi:flavodoxin [Xylocopilactobacillus apis]|uniref:Flavodoxin-like domain-containing protein n=1 Tax=Xylocopilactobacillus apis TaxID=2932183 RepID=A0AAU9CY10_9LACO|nr:flavodoxin [Xylocopilactobacillus apis]BDR57321.1 hypothetical protein KIMC2_18830 [Xylocopilactobacillus apis]
MKKRIIAFIVVVIAVIAVFIGYNVISGSSSKNSSKSSSRSSNSNNSQSSKTAKPTVSKKGKNLIVYFSRKDGVSDGPLKVGHTKVIANFIHQKIGGDVYEIIPAKDYPKGFQATADQAEKEQKDDARPKIKNKLPDVNKYDNIFIGSPIWWGGYPMVVRTFLDNVKLNNKNVFPFVTHKGSGMGDTEETLKNQFPKAKISDGLAVEGTAAEQSRKDVDEWLSKLGF